MDTDRRRERLEIAARILAGFVVQHGWPDGDGEGPRNNNRRYRVKEALAMAEILIEEVDRT